MTASGAWNRTFAAVLVLLGALCVGAGGVIFGQGDVGEIMQAMTVLMPPFLFCLIGAVIVYRRPGNRMGWIFAAIGVLSSTGSVADEYANYAVAAADKAGAPLVLASWYSEWFWIPFIFLTFCFSVLMFPSGGPPSPRWRSFIRMMTGLIAALVIIAMFDPVIASSRGPHIANPIGIRGLPDVDDEPFVLVLAVSLISGAIAALASLVVRFRRSTGEERQQLKWFTYSAAVMVSSFVFGAVILDGFFDVKFPLLEALTLGILPVGAGIAILKYRLYDIDVLINRTLVYGALSAVLVGAYAGGVLVFRTLLDPLTGDNDIAIAASTLAVAALFGPARRRIQLFIDRRFYRSRYDAQRTLEEFATRLRDEIEIDSLSAEVLGVVSDTVQPRHASVWILEEGAIR